MVLAVAGDRLGDLLCWVCTCLVHRTQFPLAQKLLKNFGLDNKKAKISKRKHGEQVAVHFYRDHGFIPWAFINFLVLLGWSTSSVDVETGHDIPKRLRRKDLPVIR